VLEASADDIRERYGVEVRTVPLDLSAPGAVSELADATADLEVGLFVYNAGGDDRSAAFLDKDLGTHLELVGRNCVGVLEAAYRFGAPMVARGRGAVVLVTSGAAWAGGATLADGPTWIYGSADPGGGAPTAALSRRQAVLLMSRGATAAA
jgi:short-subunit dehydrogenase